MMLDEVSDYCIGVGLSDGTDLFLSNMPPDPHNAVVLVETPGRPPTSTMEKARAYELPHLQVIVRNDDYQIARIKAERYHFYLSQVVNATLNGVKYLRVLPLQSPFSLGQDENNRHLVVCNYEIDKVVSPTPP